LVALNLPSAGTGNFIVVVPELFSLIEATSNCISDCAGASIAVTKQSRARIGGNVPKAENRMPDGYLILMDLVAGY
jgi:hypothetical protein